MKIDIAGQRFGRWVAISYSHEKPGSGAMWNCVCDCGTVKLVKRSSILRGESKSCGCLQRERSSAACIKRLTVHGETAGGNSRVYRIWANMNSRCSNPKFDSYPYYGGRGIKVCDEWKTFSNFLRDMGKPEAGQSIDRIDGRCDYEPGNCRWATQTEQSNNRSKNVWLEINGQRKTVAQWALEPGAVAIKTIYARAAKGWVPHRAVFETTRAPKREEVAA